MTVNFDTDRSKDLTVFRFSGEICLGDLIQAIKDYFDSGFTTYEIYDLSAYAGNPFSNDDINNLADFISDRAGNYRVEGKTAIVAHRDIDFGNFRVVAALTDIETPYDLEVFRTMETACDWLGLTP